MFKRILYTFIAVFWLVIYQYNTINYYYITNATLIQEIAVQSHMKLVLIHDCDCGCGGDLSKCDCDDKAFIFGFASCSVKVITIPVTPINLIAKLTPFEEIVSPVSECPPPEPDNQNFSPQEVVFEIFHPPALNS